MEIVDHKNVKSRQDVKDVSGFITKDKLEFGLLFLSSHIILLGHKTRFPDYKY